MSSWWCIKSEAGAVGVYFFCLFGFEERKLKIEGEKRDNHLAAKPFNSLGPLVLKFSSWNVLFLWSVLIWAHGASVCPWLTVVPGWQGWVWRLHPWAALGLLGLLVPLGSKETPPSVALTFTHTSFLGWEVREDSAALERDAKRWFFFFFYRRGKRNELFSVRGEQ